MKLLIALMFLSGVCFGQGKIKDSVVVDGTGADMRTIDSLNLKVFSTNDLMSYLTKVHRKVLAMKELDLIKDKEFDQLIKVLNEIIAEADKKRRK